MKNSYFLVLLLLFTSSFSFSQVADTAGKQKIKPSRGFFKNEIYGGYGAASMFYFTGFLHYKLYPTKTETDAQSQFSKPQSAGNFFMGYSHSLGKVVSIGIMVGYEKFHYTGYRVYHDYGYGDFYFSLTAEEQLITVIPKVTFCYLNKPLIQLYTGMGLGVTFDFGKATLNGTQSAQPVCVPGAQFTLVGLRFGRALGGFLEVGVGSYSIVNAGLSYKFTHSKKTFSLTDTTGKNKTDPAGQVLSNEYYTGYGVLTVFNYTGRLNHNTSINHSGIYMSTPRSTGNIFIGYTRSLSKVVSAGFILGYQNFHSSGTRYYTSSFSGGYKDSNPITIDDHLGSGIARFTFSYINKLYFRMYSGIGIGFTMDVGKINNNGQVTTDLQLWPAGQVILAGLHFGRALGGFFEFGFGSYGIVNAGISYKFKD